MIYENIFKTLNQNGLEYVVIGGIAVNLHGFVRATGDLDIAISLTDREVSKFVQVTKALGFVPRLPVKIEDFADAKKRDEWIQQKNMKVFSVYNPKNPIEHIDVMIEHVVDFETLFNNRVIMKDREIEIPVASITDLITLKEAAGRERDTIDIRALKKIQGIRNEK